MQPNAGPLLNSTDLAGDGASLAPEELTRYSRHLLLPEVGPEGQLRLKRGRVLVVGAGGLGSPAAMYLAAAGVGTIGIVDGDQVEVTNLQRQILYDTDDVGTRKVAAAARRLAAVNPNVEVASFDESLSSRNALAIISGFDVVIDATDNFPTRYLVNDACVLTGKPDVYGSVLRFEGQATILATRDGPCYRCLYPAPPPPRTVPGCAEAGVLGVLPGLIGVLQATEALKLLLGVGEPLIGRLLLADALRTRFHTVAIRRDPACVACGTRTLSELQDYEAFCGGRARAPAVEQMSPTDLAARLRGTSPPSVLDVREPWEWGIAHLPEARLVPLGQLEDLLGTLDPTRETVVYCHHGMRSQAAADRLVAAGFARVWNLAGGIDRWSDEVDPGVRRY